MILGRDHCYNITELTEQIRQSLEPHFKNIQVKGEVSNFRPSSTGHYYFTLKDDNAVLSGVMFRNRIRYLPFIPEDGQLITVTGNISVYQKRGSYQIICESMEKAGEGDILALLEQRKKKYAALGLFDAERKQKIPSFPKTVGVVTSPTGAAIRDIIRVLRRRNAPVNVIVLPAAVQGEEGAEQIARQIRTANRFKLADVLIVGRGGGSLEDLLPFSEEAVVEAVADSVIPVITAIGHEIDNSLADFASDLRAPTPSAAAEIVSRDGEELRQSIIHLQEILRNSLRQNTEKIRILLDQFKPAELERNFRILFQPFLLRLDDGKEALLQTMQNRISDKKHAVQLLTQSLLGDSPFEILKKGYALVSDKETGSSITAASQTVEGKKITITFASDNLDAAVTEVHGNGRKK